MGRIQSIHSFSTVDGPGTRSVVFFQGCPVRCVFCQNPDSWDPLAGEEISVESLIKRLERFRSFLAEPGLTISGGEPLAQPKFALELIKEAKNLGWHVALDTSGACSAERFIEVAGAVDLVMFSIKHPLYPERVMGYDYGKVLENWRRLAHLSVPVWLRYVLISGWTDEPEALKALGELAQENPNLERLEILPYNSLAENKWTKLGLANPLQSGPKPGVTEEQLKQAEDLTGWLKR
ncbi:MAG: radical SAM protein [Firmicutes bacterium]|nr:radical SAM protein [Bacillota bacterium]